MLESQCKYECSWKKSSKTISLITSSSLPIHFHANTNFVVMTLPTRPPLYPWPQKTDILSVSRFHFFSVLLTFTGGITEEFLSKQRDGAFIFRDSESTPGDFTLSVKSVVISLASSAFSVSTQSLLCLCVRLWTQALRDRSTSFTAGIHLFWSRSFGSAPQKSFARHHNLKSKPTFKCNWDNVGHLCLCNRNRTVLL